MLHGTICFCPFCELLSLQSVVACSVYSLKSPGKGHDLANTSSCCPWQWLLLYANSYRQTAQEAGLMQIPALSSLMTGSRDPLIGTITQSVSQPFTTESPWFLRVLCMYWEVMQFSSWGRRSVSHPDSAPWLLGEFREEFYMSEIIFFLFESKRSSG